MIKIDKGVPPPRGNAAYPWKNMEVGDSFAVPVADLPLGPQVTSGRRMTGFRFTMSKVVEGKRPMWRVWRIE